MKPTKINSPERELAILQDEMFADFKRNFRPLRRGAWRVAAWRVAALAVLAIAALLLVACGGGGDDPPIEPQPVILLDATVSSYQQTSTPTERIVADIASPQFYASGRVEVCAEGYWTQWSRRAAALELLTTMAGAGPESEEVTATAAGIVGQTVLPFKRCQAFDAAPGLTSARMRFDMRSSGASIPMQSWNVTVRWTAKGMR